MRRGRTKKTNKNLAKTRQKSSPRSPPLASKLEKGPGKAEEPLFLLGTSSRKGKSLRFKMTEIARVKKKQKTLEKEKRKKKKHGGGGKDKGPSGCHKLAKNDLRLKKHRAYRRISANNNVVLREMERPRNRLWEARDKRNRKLP